MRELGFEAFSLPRSIQTVAPSLLAYEDRGARVGYLDASPAWIRRLTEVLLDARRGLAARSVEDIAEALGRTGARFLDGDDPIRGEALALLPRTAGLSPEMAEVVLDGMAPDWSEERLLALLRSELGDAGVLDGFVHVGSGPRVMAVGPSLCVQVLAGSVPGVGVNALIRSLLVKGPTLLKPGRGDVVLPTLFARALREVDPEISEALAVVYWPGGEEDLDTAALGNADVVTAYGSDESVDTLRVRCPVTTRFVPYHHRISVGVVGREALSAELVESTAAEVAESVALFDQRGCVSPRVIFVEQGGVSHERFAHCVAEELSRLEERLPSAPLSAGEASGLHQLRGSMELMAAGGGAVVIHGGTSPWTVVLQEGRSVPGDCAGRTVWLQTVPDAGEVPRLLEPLGPHLQTVGFAGLGARLEGLARALGEAGASRVVPFRSVPFPPPWWHHDGRGPLRDLLRWLDLEESVPYSSS